MPLGAALHPAVSELLPSVSTIEVVLAKSEASQDAFLNFRRTCWYAKMHVAPCESS